MPRTAYHPLASRYLSGIRSRSSWSSCASPGLSRRSDNRLPSRLHLDVIDVHPAMPAVSHVPLPTRDQTMLMEPRPGCGATPRDPDIRRSSVRDASRLTICASDEYGERLLSGILDQILDGETGRSVCEVGTQRRLHALRTLQRRPIGPLTIHLHPSESRNPVRRGRSDPSRETTHATQDAPVDEAYRKHHRRGGRIYGLRRGAPSADDNETSTSSKAPTRR